MKRLIGLVCWGWSLSVLAAAWFDAGIERLEAWPSDGTDVQVEGQGTWTGTDNATLAARRLKVDSAPDTSLGFVPGVQKGISDATLVYSMTTRFSVKDGLPELDPAAKCGLSAMEDLTTQTKSYCGLVKNPEDGGNRWAVLSGATPDAEADVALTITMKADGERALVQYKVDETVLTMDGSEWLEIAMPEEMSGAVCFGGNGAVASLSATAESEAPAEMQALTIPAVEHLAIKSVTVAGKVIEPDENGVYHVEKGSLVTVVFAPEMGWALTGKGEVSVVVKDDMTFPEASIPGALDVAKNITINEVMAKNGVTIRTKKGFEGLDWVELHNTGDDDLNLADPNAPYYMGNDPTKKPNKWTPIQGSCIVPAHGYKIVWFDGDELCKDNEFAEDEAFVRANLSTDANKHTVFIASAADAKAIIQQITLPGGIKDISYGVGHLTRTLVAANAQAEYRVGAGAWKPVSGAVGMSAEIGAFTTVGYQINKQVSNMDVAEACVKDPSTWKKAPVTNTVETLAFAGGGSSGNFNASLYSAFPGVSGDDFVLVATGAVMIPESGDWSFAVGSDDGFTAKLKRLDKTWGWESRGARGYAQSVANFNLEAGSYELEVVYFNRGGGLILDVSAAKGRQTFDATKFALVGSLESGVVHAGALGTQVAVNVAEEMLGKSKTCDWRTTFTLSETPAAEDTIRLLVRYADGFTAKINGETVATVPAAGARKPAEAMLRTSFEIPAAKLVAGRNTLELTGENDAIGDTEFFLGAELVRDIADNVFAYFETPTPGQANGGNGRTGFTPKVSFSEPHGYKDAAFELTLSCAENADAVIYYTLDGTQPVIGSPSTFLYTAPFEVAKTTVVRAAVPDVDSILQQDASATYLFLADILAADATPPEGFPADKAINSQAVRYGMNQAIVNGDEDTQARIRRGFTVNCRTVSLVIDPKHLFDGASGIYVNASGNGRSWERPVQVEQINPMDANDEFAVPAGIRIRGAYSRGSQYPKHSFRLFFRSEYGMGTLKHALFGAEGASSFEKIDLRTEQNYSWANGSNWETFVHEVFARDSQRDMGQSYNRSRYCHLFINGVYWGLYQTEERVDQNYGESYGGGVADNYDVVRTSQPGYNTGIVEGESTAWEALWRITTQEGYGVGHEANYNKVRGLNPDGTRNSDYPVLVNVTNLIEFLLTSHFAADTDSPTRSGGPNNIAAYRNRTDGADGSSVQGFIWNRHDAEHSLSRGGNVSSDLSMRYGTRLDSGCNVNALANFNPGELHYELCFNKEYRQTFADLVYQHVLKTGGAMTAAEAEKRFRARMAELDDVIVCESARWGGGSSNRTRATWLNNCNDCIKFINQRGPYLIAAYRNLGWYPSVDPAVVIDGTGAPVAAGATIGLEDKVYLKGQGGTIYYTMDGSDPSTSEAAIEYSGASPVPVDVTVIANGANWKYFDAGSLPAANWAAANYDDASWKEGASRLGFAGSGTFATKLSKFVGGGTSGTQVTTFYFRKAFTLPEGAEKLSTLKATIDIDDAYVIYVNGVEALRENLPTGAIGYDTFATASNNGLTGERTLTFPAGTLKTGDNVIAIEVHQCNATSSDAWMNLALSYAKAGDAEGGIAVPAEGANFAIRVRSESGDWSALETIAVRGEEPPPPEDENIPEGATIYRGTYPQPVVIDGGTVAFVAANFSAGVTMSAATTVYLADGTTSTASKITSTAAPLTFEGPGALRLSGKTTLIEAAGLNVTGGRISIDFSGEVAKSSAILLTAPYIQTSGEVAMNLDSEVQVYGFYCNTKTDVEAVQLLGGTFATVIDGGESSATFKLSKGSNDVKLGGSAVDVTLAGTAPRFVNTDGKIDLSKKCGTVTVRTLEGEGGAAKVFKSAKKQTLSGGKVTIEATGSCLLTDAVTGVAELKGSEIFSSDLDIEVKGGEFNLTSSDDCFSAQTAITVSGGVVHALSTAGDALDSNGTMSITGGHVFAFTLSAEHEALGAAPAAGVASEIVIDAAATVVAVSGKAETQIAESSTATVVSKPFASVKNKFIGFTTVSEDTVAHQKTTRNYAMSWEGKYPAKFTILTAGSQLKDVQFDIKNPGKDNPEYVALSSVVEKITVKTTVEELPDVIEVAPGADPVVIAAETAEAACAAAILAVEVPEIAGLDEAVFKGYFMLAAEPVEGETDKFSVSAVLNPSVVPVPEIGATEGEGDPLAVIRSEEGSVVAVGIINAKAGLWYGYAVTEDLAEAFVDDKPSFVLATGSRVTITGTKMETPSAFYKVKVLPVQPK